LFGVVDQIAFTEDLEKIFYIYIYLFTSGEWGKLSLNGQLKTHRILFVQNNNAMSNKVNKNNNLCPIMHEIQYVITF
jgi:hypothetical protein